MKNVTYVWCFLVFYLSDTTGKIGKYLSLSHPFLFLTANIVSQRELKMEVLFYEILYNTCGLKNTTLHLFPTQKDPNTDEAGR